MSIYPLITEEKQKLYEKIHMGYTNLRNDIPDICGYYGRACRQMNDKADRMLCMGCTLSIFISTVEAIIEKCNEKEAIGIESLYDSDICDIEEMLESKCIHVDYSYIANVLDYLIEERQ